MPVRRLPNAVVVMLICLATAGALGPHLLMLGYRVAGARPPAALVFFCVLSHGHGKSHSATLRWQLHSTARPRS